MEHRVSHDLGRDLGKKVTVAAFAAYAQKYAEYNPRMTWTGDYRADAAFTVKGFELKGTVEVRDREVALDLSVPLLLRPFKSKALEVIEREIKVWVEKARRGEVA